ncbi:MAG: MaoC family dehydratase [Deltaproteobacteria bacterium]|nr:MaoC family dehydratase [Deltaproteobacteria bacterium]
MTVTRNVYGRKLDDFEEGKTYRHPWEVTLDEGVLAFCAASFMETSPIYSSDLYAIGCGFKRRLVHPLVLLNFGLSFSVLDVSEQAIAHLAYIDVRFPNPAYFGDTITAASEVLGTKLSGSGDKGTVHVRTTVWNQDKAGGVRFERMALIPKGKVEGSVRRPWNGAVPRAERRYPAALNSLDLTKLEAPDFSGFFEDFTEGQIIVHDTGRTVGDTEHMQLTTIFRNTHPLHFDAKYCETRSFANDRVVYGGLVLGFTHAIAARDTGGQMIWAENFDNGAHPGPTLAGDTIRAAQKVLKTEDAGAHLGKVTFRLVGVKTPIPRNSSMRTPICLRRSVTRKTERLKRKSLKSIGPFSSENVRHSLQKE